LGVMLLDPLKLKSLTPYFDPSSDIKQGGLMFKMILSAHAKHSSGSIIPLLQRLSLPQVYTPLADSPILPTTHTPFLC